MSNHSIFYNLSEVSIVLSECHQMISQKNANHVLPYCDQILSDLYLLVQCAAAAQRQQQQLGELETEEQLWWDSSPENVAYCDSDQWDPCDQCTQDQCEQVDQDLADQCIQAATARDICWKPAGGN